jgi:hypothetical protein
VLDVYVKYLLLQEVITLLFLLLKKEYRFLFAHLIVDSGILVLSEVDLFLTPIFGRYCNRP